MSDNVYDVSKLAFHKEKLEALAKGEIIAPVYVRVKPTNRCDHECTYCSYSPDNDCPVSETINLKDEIPREKMLEILGDFRDIGIKALTFSGGGEPLVYPHIAEIMQMTLDYGIDLSIISNGQKLRGEKANILKNAKWVRVSAGECDAEGFEKTRRRPAKWFYELKENLANFSQIKNPDCEFGINYVVHNGNFDRIYDSVKYFKELGVNHIKITPCWNPDFIDYHEPLKPISLEQIANARADFQAEGFTVYDTYENDFKSTGLSDRNYDKCSIMQIIPVIGADAAVYFCHDKTYSGNGCLGSIKNRSFKNLWFSEDAAKIFREFNPRKQCQHHCTYDSRNLLTLEMLGNMKNLDKYKPKSEKHKNFP